MFKFTRASQGRDGVEELVASAETPLGREAFRAPNTVSRALFKLTPLDDDDGQVLLTVLASTSRLKVVRGDQTTDLPHNSSCLLADGDLLQLLGNAESFVYRFGAEARARQEAPKRIKVDQPVATASAAPVEPAAVQRVGSKGGGGFTPVPFKFYRNLVAVDGFDNAQNVLNLRPFFGEPGLVRVCLTSYELDAVWLVRAFPSLQHVPVFVACRARPVPCPPNWEHVSPKLPQYGTCHGKLMLLYFADRVRVILTSANHIEADHLFKCNALWTQEFPLLATPAAASSLAIGYRADRNDFAAVLQDYLQRLGTPPLYSDLRRLDCSKAAVALVSSVPGAHSVRMQYGSDEKKVFCCCCCVCVVSIGSSYARLAQVLAAEQCLSSQRLVERSPLIVQCSSLGKLSQNYINAFQFGGKEERERVLCC